MPIPYVFKLLPCSPPLTAEQSIRNAESALGVTANSYLHIEPMNGLWGSGDPNQYLTNTYFTAYDDHRYLKYDSSVAVSHSSYLSNSCNANRNSDNETPTIVGEFSLSPPTDVQDNSDWSTSSQTAFYKQWFAAQVTNFESNTEGWVFWSWKTQLGDYRWSYQGMLLIGKNSVEQGADIRLDAVAAGVIPTNIQDVFNEGACNGF
jgi:hypothetical protein